MNDEARKKDQRLVKGIKNNNLLFFECPYCNKHSKKDGTIIIAACEHYRGQEGEDLIFEDYIMEDEKIQLDKMKFKIPTERKKEQIDDTKKKLVEVMNKIFEVGELLPWKKFKFKLMKITDDGLLILMPVEYKRK